MAVNAFPTELFRDVPGVDPKIAKLLESVPEPKPDEVVVVIVKTTMVRHFGSSATRMDCGIYYIRGVERDNPFTHAIRLEDVRGHGDILKYLGVINTDFLIATKKAPTIHQFTV